MSKYLEKSNAELQNEGIALYKGVAQIIDNAQKRASLFLNNETTLLYWSIGRYINMFLKDNNRTAYGNRIIATLSQQLTEKVGKGYTYTALTRMDELVTNCNRFKDYLLVEMKLANGENELPHNLGQLEKFIMPHNARVLHQKALNMDRKELGYE